MKKSPKVKRSTEMILLSRLKWIECSLYLWGLGFFIYGISTTSEENQDLVPDSLVAGIEASQEFSPHDFFNFFVLSVLFFGLGSFCNYFNRKKLRKNRSKKVK